MKTEFSIEKARRAQIGLSKRIILEDRLPPEIRYVAGADVAYVNDISIAAAVLLDYQTLQIKESKTDISKTSFPYIPTLLSFREIPGTVTAVKKLGIKPDIILADGHGYAHPYRCGFASHLGLALKEPTIGVAKTLLCGRLEKLNRTEDTIFILDRDQIIGAQVTTKPGQKPVYVSVGHMISLETAIKIVEHCTVHSRIPEPIALAHKIATAEKGKINIST
jgi:deoxyribonuclease V